MKYSSDLNLGEGLCICTSFHFPDSGLYLLNGFDFYLIYFEWRDTENQQQICTTNSAQSLGVLGAVNPGLYREKDVTERDSPRTPSQYCQIKYGGLFRRQVMLQSIATTTPKPPGNSGEIYNSILDTPALGTDSHGNYSSLISCLSTNRFSSLL